MDRNKDGYITMKELRKGLKNSHDTAQIDLIMDGVDTDKNGAIDYNEFIAATLDVEIAKNVKKLDQAFKFFDKNSDGKIDHNDIGQVLMGEEFKSMNPDIVKNILSEVEVDKEGEVNYRDFMR